MNKKFSTLVAGFLLAGGLFGTANAIDIRTAEKDQYYKLKCTAWYGSASWVDAASQNWYLFNDGGDVKAAAQGNIKSDIASYWTIETRTTAAGVKEVRFLNAATGKVLEVGNKDGWFNVKTYISAGNSFGSITASGDINELTFNSTEEIHLAYTSENTGASVWNVTSKKAAEANANNWLIALDAEAVAATEYTTATINKVLGTGFGLQIGYINDKDKFVDYTLVGGAAFQGTMEAKEAIANVSAYATDSDDETFYLYNKAAKKYVVLLNEKWTKNETTDLIGGEGKGYKFGLMTAKEIKADFEKAADKRAIKAALFGVTAPANADNAPLEVAVIKAGESNANLELFVAEVDGKYYLTTNKDNTTTVADYEETFVKFGVSNLADWTKLYGQAINIKCIKGENAGKTLVPNVATATWENADYVAFSKPEGQWIITEGVNGELVLTNRETSVDSNFDLSNLRNDGDDIYYVDADTRYEITKALEFGEGENSFAYYGDLKADNANNGEAQTYAIKFINKVTGEPNYVGMDGEGKVVLTSNLAAAINFKAHKTATTDIIGDDGAVKDEKATDVFSVMNDIMVYNKDDKAWELKAAGDTINYYRYTLEYDGKYLAKSGDKLELVNADDANNYVVKLKDGDVVNVINVESTDADEVDANLLTEEASNMLYFDFNYAQLKQAKNIYNWVANAQLQLQGNAPAVYRTIAAPDTLEFFRTEYADEFLFEHGEFLGMTYNREKYNPAIFVDTAYVRGETKKPFYMLAVGVDKTDATQKCPICGKEDCEHAEEIPGMIAARYLVSFTDSVAAHRAELNNKFYYAGTKMTKLGFVPAVHHVDTLVIETPAKKVLVGDQKINPAKFAFRIVNAETEDFVIETALRNSLSDASQGYKIAYVKWHNGTPVLTENLNEAEVFNVRETSETPTANEGVNTSSVEVIAGNGVVTVNGAQGKNVVITNVLGQTIANTVVTSDNATIAAPAGVVVVAVEGEAAVKAIVK